MMGGFPGMMPTIPQMSTDKDGQPMSQQMIME
jgi:hypothetical protein